MTINDATKDYVSIGCLAGQLQKPVRSIERAAVALGIEPALRLNNVPHFDGKQAERIATELTKPKISGPNADAGAHPSSATPAGSAR